MPRPNPSVTWLSPRHRSDQFTKPVPLSAKVDLFEARVSGWQLQIADECANGIKGQPADPHAGFAVLHLCLSYFETIGKYEEGYAGNDQSKKHFKLGLRSVFPNLRRTSPAFFETRTDLLYKAARCGLYHASQASSGVLLARPSSALRFHPKRDLVLVNPYLLPGVLQEHLKRYCNRVLRPRNRILRANFERRFDHDNPGLA